MKKERLPNYRGIDIYPNTHLSEVPSHTIDVFSPKRSSYCVGIPVLNEGEKIHKQLKEMKKFGLDRYADILLFDGGSTDGALEKAFLREQGVRGLLTKTGAGRQGAQLRMGFAFVLKEGYLGIVTIDGNHKDSVEDIPKFIEKLKEGFHFIQGSRFVPGGRAINTPWMRWLAVRLIHAPALSWASGFHFTDTTLAYRGISSLVLSDDRLALFRNIFSGYELLFYMSARIPSLGYNCTEIAVTRSYPSKGKTPTKITWCGNFGILRELYRVIRGFYNPLGKD